MIFSQCTTYLLAGPACACGFSSRPRMRSPPPTNNKHFRNHKCDKHHQQQHHNATTTATAMLTTIRYENLTWAPAPAAAPAASSTSSSSPSLDASPSSAPVAVVIGACDALQLTVTLRNAGAFDGDEVFICATHRHTDRHRHTQTQTHTHTRQTALHRRARAGVSSVHRSPDRQHSHACYLPTTNARAGRRCSHNGCHPNFTFLSHLLTYFPTSFYQCLLACERRGEHCCHSSDRSIVSLCFLHPLMSQRHVICFQK